MKNFNDAIDAFQSGHVADAISIWTALAESGDIRSQYNLGVLYDAGECVPPNPWEAAMWFRKAAENGFADAQFNLAIMLLNGQGVAKNEAEAGKSIF